MHLWLLCAHTLCLFRRTKMGSLNYYTLRFKSTRCHATPQWRRNKTNEKKKEKTHSNVIIKKIEFRIFSLRRSLPPTAGCYTFLMNCYCHFFYVFQFPWPGGGNRMRRLYEKIIFITEQLRVRLPTYRWMDCAHQRRDVLELGYFDSRFVASPSRLNTNQHSNRPRVDVDGSGSSNEISLTIVNAVEWTPNSSSIHIV